MEKKKKDCKIWEQKGRKGKIKKQRNERKGNLDINIKETMMMTRHITQQMGKVTEIQTEIDKRQKHKQKGRERRKRKGENL